jgi:hypothetical protein
MHRMSSRMDVALEERTRQALFVRLRPVPNVQPWLFISDLYLFSTFVHSTS